MKTVEQLIEEHAYVIYDDFTERLLDKGSILFDSKEQLVAFAEAYLKDRL